MVPEHGESKGQSRERVGWSVPTSKTTYCWKVIGGPEGPEGVYSSPRPEGTHTAPRSILALRCNTDGKEDLSWCIQRLIPSTPPTHPAPKPAPAHRSLGQGIMNRKRSREVKGFRKSAIHMGVADWVF